MEERSGFFERGLFEPFSGRRVLLTGGTGFFGKSLLLAFASANLRFAAKIEVVSLSRSPERLFAANPEFARLPGVEFVSGDVRSFALPGARFDFAVHAATEASAKLERERPEEMRSVIVEGTKRALAVAKEAGVSRFLNVSSGGVYGVQPPDLERLSEDFPCSPFTAYGQGKLEAERLCSQVEGMACPSARCFSFVGPHLPMDSHFAIGNFIRDAAEGRAIVVQGDGSPTRSYLYSDDLVEWLLRVLAGGRHGRAYNVGSEEAVSIKELAAKVKRIAGSGAELRILGSPVPGASNRYVPSCARAREELGLKPRVPLDDAIARTLESLRLRAR